ncbi:hypothetical protein ABT301_18775 [Streptomyces sp. NPDC000987]|uniref:hypothetical protein n=1 Tax=Streptomyces sp. NPDC000987 TaxID=3154374 RepID=UPI00331C609D
MPSTSGGAGHSGAFGVPSGKETAFSCPATRRAWRRSRALHQVRHLGPYALLAVLSGLCTALGVPRWLVAVVVGTGLVVAVPAHRWRCRHASVNARRARLVLEHYPWRPCLLERGADLDDQADRASARKWRGPFFRLADPDVTGGVWVHGVPGPGPLNSSVRSPCAPHVLDEAFDAAGGQQRAWFAGDLRFGGVLSPAGGGRPVLTHARGRRGLKGEHKAAPPEQDALAVRAGLLEYDELPTSHPLRRAHENGGPGGGQAAPRPGPARPVTGGSPAARAAVRTALALFAALALLTGLLLAFGAVRPDDTDAVTRIAVGMLASLALGVSFGAGAALADDMDGRSPLRWLRRLSECFFWTAFALFWACLFAAS